MELFLRGYAKDEKELLNLCKTLWLPRKKQKKKFELWFQQAFAEAEFHWLDIQVELLEEDEKKGSNSSTTSEGNSKQNLESELGPSQDKLTQEKAGNDQESSPSSNQLDEKFSRTSDSPQMKDIILNFEEEDGNRAKLLPEEERKKYSQKRYIYNSIKHQPLSNRRLERALQKLCLKQGKAPTQTLNIPLMVEQFARNHYTLQLAFEQKDISTQQVILLTEHKGSMTPFETWGDTLHRAFLDSKGIHTVHRYYFHRFPLIDNQLDNPLKMQLFTNPDHTQTHTVRQLFQKASQDATWLVIYGEGGVNESPSSSEQLKHWEDFLEIAKNHMSAISWINPYPESRWKGTNAKYMSFMVHMHPYNLQGIQSAISLANHANR
ncbi:MAG: hypothetical protein AAFW00_28825 [Bacteroidota bacterium]